METVQQNVRFALFSIKFPSNIYVILFAKKLQRYILKTLFLLKFVRSLPVHQFLRLSYLYYPELLVLWIRISLCLEDFGFAGKKYLDFFRYSLSPPPSLLTRLVSQTETVTDTTDVTAMITANFQ